MSFLIPLILPFVEQPIADFFTSLFQPQEDDSQYDEEYDDYG